MGHDRTEQAADGWMLQHQRTLAALMLSFLLAPTLLFAATAVWFTARGYPGFAGAAALALILVVVRVRRRRLRHT